MVVFEAHMKVGYNLAEFLWAVTFDCIKRYRNLEVRRAVVQVLLDSDATLTIVAMNGRDLAQPEAVLAVERRVSYKRVKR